MIRKFFFLKLAIFFLVLECCAGATTIGVVFNQKYSVYQNAFLGFKRAARDSGWNVFSLQVDSEQKSEDIAKMIQVSEFTHLFAMGEQPVLAARKVDLPGVFSMVNNPQELGLIGEGGGLKGKLTGICVEIDYRKKMEILRKAFPGIKKIGIVYNPSSSLSIIKDLLSAADYSNYTVVESVVSSIKDVLMGFSVLKDKRVDAIFAIPDQMVYHPSTLKNIFMFSFHNRIPLIGFTDSMAKNGAVISFYLDYEKVGAQAFKLMKRIIDEPGSAPPIENPEGISFSVNLKMIKQMNLEVQESFISENANQSY